MTAYGKYRKLPVEITAWQVPDCGEKPCEALKSLVQNMRWEADDNGVLISTLEGEMLASPGDYIIKGVKGEYYPCKPDIFAKTYELVEALNGAE